MKVRLLRFLPFLLVMAGCSAIPQEFVKPGTPSALLRDSFSNSGLAPGVKSSPGNDFPSPLRSGKAFFLVAKIDGVEVEDNSARRSLTASEGQGLWMTPRSNEIRVAAGRHRLHLLATYFFAAPIEVLLRMGKETAYRAEGEIIVDLGVGRTYQVRGRLEPYYQEVWLEDVDSGEIIGQKIINRKVERSRQEILAASSYTCCNLRYKDQWISDSNLVGLPFIPAGARILPMEEGGNRIHVLIDGRPMTVGHDYGRQQESKQAYLAKLMRGIDPGIYIERQPAAVRDAIRAGKVSLGMNREQVLIALGYPRTDQTATLQETRWKYETVDGEVFEIEWNSQGLVDDVLADEEAVLEQVVF